MVDYVAQIQIMAVDEATPVSEQVRAALAELTTGQGHLHFEASQGLLEVLDPSVGGMRRHTMIPVAARAQNSYSARATSHLRTPVPLHTLSLRQGDHFPPTSP
jgi:hypothetical protein